MSSSGKDLDQLPSPVNEVGQRSGFPTDNDALMGIQAVDTVNMDTFENNGIFFEPTAHPSGLVTTTTEPQHH